MIMMYYIYNIFLVLALLVYSPFYINKYRKSKGYKSDLLQRLGLNLPGHVPKKGMRILIHSVSVGETRAVIPVIKELKARRPHWEIILTTTTGTGRKIAEQIKPVLCGIYYFPLDLGPVCDAFLRRVRPDLVCLTETEIWPSFIIKASRHKIPLCLINGRISDRSFRNYKILGFFIRRLLERFNSFCMQSLIDNQRILILGAPKEKVIITGNIKFDSGDLSFNKSDTQAIKDKAGINAGQNVIVAGSTHPGEEHQLIDAFLRLLPSYPDLILIIAPRHVERSEEIAKRIEATGKRYVYWSDIDNSRRGGNGQIVIIDSIGVLAKIYSIADIVFIGGSLIPHGGQNPLEPAFFGKPILFGPYMENFRSISKMLLKEGAALEVRPSDLFQAILELLNNREIRVNMGKAGRRVIETNQGAAKRTCDQIIRLLKDYHGHF